MLTMRLQKTYVTRPEPSEPTPNAAKDSLYFVTIFADQIVVTTGPLPQWSVAVGFTLYPTF